MTTDHRPPATPGVWVTAECDRCGRVPLRPAAFQVSGETYTYQCPTCGQPCTRPATPDVVHVLARAHRRDHYLTHAPTTRTEAPSG